MFNKITPKITVKDISESLEYYERLGFKSEEEEILKSGIELYKDGCKILLTEQATSNMSQAPGGSNIIILVDNLQSLKKLNLTLCLQSLAEVIHEGEREFKSKDPDGNVITFCLDQ